MRFYWMKENDAPITFGGSLEAYGVFLLHAKKETVTWLPAGTETVNESIKETAVSRDLGIVAS